VLLCVKWEWVPGGCGCIFVGQPARLAIRASNPESESEAMRIHDLACRFGNSEGSKLSGS